MSMGQTLRRSSGGSCGGNLEGVPALQRRFSEAYSDQADPGDSGLVDRSGWSDSCPLLAPIGEEMTHRAEQHFTYPGVNEGN